MAELKTQPNAASVSKFLAGLKDEAVRRDCKTLVTLMRAATKKNPVMWGSSIVGFGTFHYRYASGREGDWFLVGFSPRTANLTIYLIAGLHRYPDLMKKLGKYRSAKSCLYVKSLADISIPVLRQLLRRSIKDTARIYR